ncbi:MAG: hypothetical protein ACRECE_02730, partial [Xanthobacteraceae bacterium]
HGRTSGLCQPIYVLDIPGGYGKSPIGPTYLAADGSAVQDFNGRRHRYPPDAGLPPETLGDETLVDVARHVEQ